LLALGAGAYAAISARLALCAVLAATIVAALHALEQERRGGHVMAKPRRVFGGKGRYAKQRNDQSQHSHGFPQSVVLCENVTT
jgi:hypothetical protein